jgi:glycosyltransferase involved in cell wall biosynthesis
MMRNRPPFVSICVPVRNGERQLSHTISNLMHSAYPQDRLEILFGDHSSTDMTMSVIAGFQERFPRLRVVQVPFTGPKRAVVRNRIIRESKGELLIFIDHDILVPDDFVSKHVEAHEKFPSSIVAGAMFGTTLGKEAGRLAAGLDLDHISASQACLTGNPAFSDPRIQWGSVPDGEVVDMLGLAAPFCFFWSGNVSAYRSDIDECGHFDETYDGWGMEDDDFAQQFRVKGRGMAFSRSAWGFHQSRPADNPDKGWQARQNFDKFFQKFSTREVETFSLYGPALLPLAAKELEGWLSHLRRIDIWTTLKRLSRHLGPVPGRRMCYFVLDQDVADVLQLTDALSPFGPPTQAYRFDGRTHWWPLIGFKTPFVEKEIDEAILLVEELMWCNRYMLTLLLAETARIAKRAVFYCSAESEARAEGFPVRALREVICTVNFSSVSWVTL